MGLTVLDIDLGLFLPAVALLLLYFVPTFVAYTREHPSFVAILLVNIFLGGTLVGWFVALAWSLTAVDRDG